MKSSSKVFKVGTRSSKLARIQTGAALERLQSLLPGLRFEAEPCSSPGDRDRQTDLRDTPADFFTRDLDQAILEGCLDAALHSAKDVPECPNPELDWFWLPWSEDARDAWVLRPGLTCADLPPSPRVGISSGRREQYVRTRFPDARAQPIRGDIEQRLAQLDRGEFDAVLIAGAALLRLDLADRITEWIPLEDLPTPDGQGTLCMTFRSGDRRFTRIRSLFVKSAVFVGAGVGAADLCTLAGAAAIERCDVCLHDALLDPALLDRLPAQARRIAVGKRAGAHSVPQEATTRLIAAEIRKGRRVVRLKGGDPGMFGRLAEETEALDALALPYRVIAGVSSLNIATTGTGLLLTRRGVARGFCALTPREQGGAVADIRATARARLPLVFFMAAQVFDQVAAQLTQDGWPAATPVAFIIDAGGEKETILRETIGTITTERLQCLPVGDAPVLCLVGSAASGGYRRDSGALAGKRILLPCSEALQQRAADSVRDAGGIPIQRPFIRLNSSPDAASRIGDWKTYDWIIITSPSAVQCLLDVLRKTGMDLRVLPRLLVCGTGTADALRRAGLQPDAAPPAGKGGAQAAVDLASTVLKRGQRVLRLRSDKAGPALARVVETKCGVTVNDVELYRNAMIVYKEKPDFDAAVFTSGSTVEALAHQWGAGILKSKTTVAIGAPTAAVMQGLSLRCDAVSPEPTIESAINCLAIWEVLRTLKTTKYDQR